MKKLITLTLVLFFVQTTLAKDFSESIFEKPSLWDKIVKIAQPQLKADVNIFAKTEGDYLDISELSLSVKPTYELGKWKFEILLDTDLSKTVQHAIDSPDYVSADGTKHRLSSEYGRHIAQQIALQVGYTFASCDLKVKAGRGDLRTREPLGQPVERLAEDDDTLNSVLSRSQGYTSREDAPKVRNTFTKKQTFYTGLSVENCGSFLDYFKTEIYKNDSYTWNLKGGEFSINGQVAISPIDQVRVIAGTNFNNSGDELTSNFAVVYTPSEKFNVYGDATVFHKDKDKEDKRNDLAIGTNIFLLDSKLKVNAEVSCVLGTDCNSVNAFKLYAEYQFIQNASLGAFLINSRSEENAPRATTIGVRLKSQF